MDSGGRSKEDCASWLQRVNEVQTSRMTPERREEIRVKVERSRMAEASRRKCKAVRSHAVRSKALVSEGLRQMQNASAPDDFSMVHSRWSAAQEASERRQLVSMEKVAQMDQISEAAVMRMEDEAADEAGGFAEVAALIAAPAAAAPPVEALRRGASGEGAEDEFTNLLNQLKTEPPNDTELGAKFGLYETYGTQVEKMRGTLFGIYDENKPTLPEAVQKDMEKQLKKIDSAEAMGIDDQAREWFVYHMMKKAGQNNQNMSDVMEGFEKRLEFLAANDQDECPICLDKFSETVISDTLGCCHKVCRECWEHWCTVTYGHPFCPLCKNDEFVETVHSRAGTQGTD